MDIKEVEEITIKTTDIIYEVMNGGQAVQSIDVNWDVKTINSVDILTPNVKIVYA